jgi:formyltetrahydrofolate-dependent phosphoribosylglycinamide formyltransferase
VSSQVQIAVLASGRGSNLQALLDGLPQPESSGRVALVVSNRDDAPVLDRARERDIPAATIARDGTDAGALLALLRGHDIGLVILAGYLKRIPDAVVTSWRGRVLNIHPALLPAFGGPGMYGRRVHEAVLASGVRMTGATVHVVDEQYDHGPIVAQWPVPVRTGDTPESLAARVLEVEHRLLPATVRAACQHMSRFAEPPRPLALCGEAFVLSDTPETDFDSALTPA